MVPARKIPEYLLSESHPEGRAKAAFFRSFGFRRDRPEVLEAALLLLARTVDVTEMPFAFGTKYVGTGSLQCPDGREAQVIVVWVLLDHQPPPRFVTAYPA
jgi:hypothetical protein